MKNEFITLVAVLVINVYSYPIKEDCLKDTVQLFEDYILTFHKHYKSLFDKELHYEAFLNSLRRLTNSTEFGNYPELFELNEFADHVKGEASKISDEHEIDKETPEKGPFYFLVEEFPGNLQSSVEIARKRKQKPSVDLSGSNNNNVSKKNRLRDIIIADINIGDLDLEDIPEMFESFIKRLNKQYKNKNQKSQHIKEFLESLKDILKIAESAGADEIGKLRQRADKFQKIVSKDDEELSGFEEQPRNEAPSLKLEPQMTHRMSHYDLDSVMSLIKENIMNNENLYDDKNDKRKLDEVLNKNLKAINYFARKLAYIFDLIEHTDVTPEEFQNTPDY